MSVNWTKQDIRHIARTLRNNSIFLYKGYFFVNASLREDVLSKYLLPFAVEGGGATSMSLSRPVIEQSVKEAFCQSCEFILRNSDRNLEFVFAIVFSEANIKQIEGDQFEFAIAHEIGHVVHGDLLMGNAAPAESELGRYHERKADAFAADVLGTKEGGIAMFENVLAELKMEQGALIFQQLTGNSALLAELLTERLNHLRA